MTAELGEGPVWVERERALYFVICGLRGGLYSFEPATGSFALLVPIESGHPRHRINDGFVDATGCLWFGTLHEDCKTAGGALYRYTKNQPPLGQDAGYLVTNGPAVSPDSRTLYHTDSAARTVYAFEPSTAGTLSNKQAA